MESDNTSKRRCKCKCSKCRRKSRPAVARPANTSEQRYYAIVEGVLAARAESLLSDAALQKLADDHGLGIDGAWGVIMLVLGTLFPDKFGESDDPADLAADGLIIPGRPLPRVGECHIRVYANRLDKSEQPGNRATAARQHG